MGRIDATIPDDLESQFRIEIIKRFGGKKGDLQRAVQEALELWVNKPLLENLGKIATDPSSTPPFQEKVVETITDIGGYGAKAKLGEIAVHPDSYQSTKELALERISRLSRGVVRFPRLP